MSVSWGSAYMTYIKAVSKVYVNPIPSTPTIPLPLNHLKLIQIFLYCDYITPNTIFKKETTFKIVIWEILKCINNYIKLCLFSHPEKLLYEHWFCLYIWPKCFSTIENKNISLGFVKDITQCLWKQISPKEAIISGEKNMKKKGIGEWKKKRTKEREQAPHHPRWRLPEIWQLLNKTQSQGDETCACWAHERSPGPLFGWLGGGKLLPTTGINQASMEQLLLCSMTCSFQSGKLQSREQHSSGWVWCQGSGFHPTYSCTKGWLWQQFLGYNFINSLFFPDFQCEFRPQHRFRLTSLFCVITF